MDKSEYLARLEVGPTRYPLTENGTNNYTGIAKKGRVPDRIIEHIGEIPGAKVQIEQQSSIKVAEKKETNIISRMKPKYNKKGK